MGASAVVALQGTAGGIVLLHLAITTAPSSTDASGAALVTQPQITLEDSGNAPFTGQADLITATITSGGVSVTSPTATINGVTGIATFSGLALNALAGPYTLTFTDTSSGSVTAAVSGTITVSVGAATQLAITTQPSAAEVSGVALARQPVVKVEDSGGNVLTSVNSGSATATVNGAASITGATASFASGVATFTTLTLTGTSGTSDTLSFTGDSVPGGPSSAITLSTAATKVVITTPSSTTALSGVALAVQPVVTVEDASNNTVLADSSSSVTALVTGAGGTVTNGTVAVVNGVATFSSLAINALAGAYTLTFTDGALTTAVSASITISVGPAAKLAILVQPSPTVQSGAALSQQPVVQVQDSGGNRVTTNSSIVTATLTAGSGTITNGFVAASTGQATFVGLAINAPAGAYTLTFSDGSLTTAVSTGIVVNVGAAAKLVVTTQPSTTVASGAVLAIQPVVTVQDSGGNVITGAISTVTAVVTLGTNTAINNTATVNAVTGQATFSGMALNALVGSYTLTFSDGLLATAVSNSISVTPGTASKLAITTQPSTTDASGAALATPPVVKVEDAAGNVVTTDSSTVTAVITGGGGTVTSPTAVAVAGVASFSGTALNALVGPYTLTVTDGTLTSAVSTSITVTVGAATKLVVSTEPSAIGASGVALAVQPVIKVVDSGGNLVTSVTTGNVTATVYTGSGGTVSAGGTAAFSAGVATFSGLAITGVSGSHYTLSFNGNSFTVNDATSILVGTAQATITVTSLSGYYGRTVTLTTSGGSGSGALTFVITGGTAAGCSITGTTLSYTSTGTCLVIASKAGDATYLSASSAAATVSISKLPIPAPVRVTFAKNSSTLTTAGKNALTVLASKLTTHSSVNIIGYAKGNLTLAKKRASVVAQYLQGRVRVKVQFHWDVGNPLEAARVLTTGQ
ncbi:MAG: beta strand repeat-containing protein [Acidimicrobiales bacterium]